MFVISRLIRVRNALLRVFRNVYNAVMGPHSRITAVRGASLEAAADAAAVSGWNQNDNAVGGRIGQYIKIIFIGKLDSFGFTLFPCMMDLESKFKVVELSFFFHNEKILTEMRRSWSAISCILVFHVFNLEVLVKKHI